jgi:DNA-binding transcriptional regulator PaaX
MRGSVTLKILEVISDMGENAVDGFTAFMNAGYGASFSRLNYEFSKAQGSRASGSISGEEEIRLRQRYANIISRLRKDGLIAAKGSHEKKGIFLTPKGIKKMLWFREQNSRLLPLTHYPKEAGKEFVIATFDIPETERWKRDWLRMALRNLGFRMVQQSVLIGKVKIPQEFLDDLKKLRLVKYIEIFGVNKTGTLEQIT